MNTSATVATQPAAALTICLVCNTGFAIYTYRQGVIRALVARGVRVVVLAPRDRTFPLLEEMGCECIDLPVASKGTNPLHDLRTLTALYRHYRAIRPNVVFHYTI
ncbi:MAG: glycosyltransferase, partial [Trinickia sp.]